MSPDFWFTLAFLCTLVSLSGVLWTGLRWKVRLRRKLHLGLVGLTVLLLVWTVERAYALGEVYDLESAGMIFHVHMFLARLATLSLAVPITSGFWVLKRGEGHGFHKFGAFLAFGLVALAAVTGFWMLSLAEPLG